MRQGSKPGKPSERRRGAAIRPPNRFLATHAVPDFEACPVDDDEEPSKGPRTEVIEDHSKTIVTRNKSPDLAFEYSINAYRGCEHGCSYCYARPTHETLGFDAGLDFETRIVVKPEAPRLLRETLAKPSWQPAMIMMSGVTDCYQPLERRYKLTRGCLEAMLEYRNPVGIVTKNVLVLRDLDLLGELAERKLVHVYLSITTLQEELQKAMEPRTSTPTARLEAVRRLRLAGVPVGVLVAPVIPGLTDAEIPAILRAAAEAGAQCAHYVLLRLPLTVRPVFLDWLARQVPERKARIESLIRDVRDGGMNDASFGRRQHGSGAYADQIAASFRVFARRYGLDSDLPALDTRAFRRPRAPFTQPELFSEA